MIIIFLLFLLPIIAVITAFIGLAKMMSPSTEEEKIKGKAIFIWSLIAVVLSILIGLSICSSL